jgi:hypothetical protein
MISFRFLVVITATFVIFSSIGHHRLQRTLVEIHRSANVRRLTKRKHPLGSKSASKNALEQTSSLPRKPNPFIAVCFCGQFWRDAILSRPVSSLFPGVPEAKFYAFIAMSQQNSELNDGHDLMNGSAICGRLSDLGFEDCFHDLRPYVASVFVDATQHLGFKGNSLYPHRTASFFSTISRALSMVNSSLIEFDEVVVTRADVYDKIQAKVDGSWYQRGRWNIIGHGIHDAVDPPLQPLFEN